MNKIKEIDFETLDEVNEFIDRFGIKRENIINIESSRQKHNLFFINTNNEEMSKYLKKKEKENYKEEFRVVLVVIVTLIIIVIAVVGVFVLSFLRG